MGKPPHPRSELSELLTAWRSKKYRSAKDFIESGQFGFTYGRYASYERGEIVPQLDVLVQIAEHLGQDPAEAVVAWLAPQLPTEELKIRFSRQALLGDRRHRALAAKTPSGRRDTDLALHIETGGIVEANAIPGDALDRTWVLGRLDLKAFDENPSLFKFLVAIHMMSPAPYPIKDLGFASPLAFERFRKTHLRRWIDDGNLKVDGDTVTMVKSHFYIPKTAEWQSFRKKIVQNSIDEIMSQLTEDAVRSGEMKRVRMSRYMTKTQRDQLFARVDSLEKFCFAIPFDAKEKPEPYTLVVLCGRESFEVGKGLAKTASPARRKKR